MTAETQPAPKRKRAPVALRRRTARARRARVRLAREDGAEFNRFVLKHEETGAPIQNAPYHEAWHRDMDEHDRIVMWGHVESGKGLALDTPIPTPRGWVAIGDLAIGDRVFGGDGEPATVTGASPIHHRPCFRVTFDDGESLVADDQHRWMVRSVDDASVRRKNGPSARHAGDGDLCACSCGMRAKNGKRFIHNHHGRKTAGGWRVVSTAELVSAGILRKSGARRADGSAYDQYKWRIPLCGSVMRDELALPLDPYVLGAWLGDGSSTDGSICCHEDDREIVDRCAERLGGSTYESRPKAQPHVILVRFHGLRTVLRKMGVFGSKHVPPAYLAAGREQRLELLAGLLDTDGHATARGTCEFYSTKRELAAAAAEVARSLGFKVSMREKPVFSPVDKRPLGKCWTVTFYAPVPVFRLERKRRLQSTGPPFGRAGYRSIASIEPVESVPTKCITVDSAGSTYLAGRSYTVTHNTQQVSIGRVLFDLGRNPELRNVIISATASAATKIGTVIKQYIEESDELHEVFPNLQPGGKKWTENAFTVRRKSRAKDASVQSVGLYGMIYGSRIDRLVLDDVLRWENVQTAAARDKSERWLLSTLWGRMTARSKMWWLGNAWHPQDAMHNIAKNERWLARRYPVLDETGKSVWPEQWSMDRIEAFKIDPGPLEYARQLMCKSQDDSSRRCKDEWIKLCKAEGEGIAMVHALNLLDRDVVPEGCFTVTGVDLASSKKKSAMQKLTAKTVVFTILVYPNEDRQVLCVDSGQFTAPQIRDKVIEHHDRYGSSVFVEDNGVQGWMLELISEKRAIPVLAFHTGMNKWDPATGVETVFVEFSNAKWVIPSIDGVPLSQEVIEWLSECSNFHPSTHTGDHLMAAWFAKEGARYLSAVARAGREHEEADEVTIFNPYDME